ncbi:hypothetical protein JCM4914_40480 [Streptomyces platensis subsp. malvinus]
MPRRVDFPAPFGPRRTVDLCPMERSSLLRTGTFRLYRKEHRVNFRDMPSLLLASREKAGRERITLPAEAS